MMRAIQEHAKKIQQMEEDLAKLNAGGTAERITRRKTMENDAAEKEKGQWSPPFITLNGWVDWDRKMETMTDSADAKQLLDNIFHSLPAHRRKVIDGEITYSDLKDRVSHLKIMIRIKPGEKKRMYGRSGTGFLICTVWERRGGLKNWFRLK